MVAAREWVENGVVEMSEEEMFLAAVDGIDAQQVYQGKYGGGGPSLSHVLPPRPDPPKSDDPYADADAIFAAEFGGDLVPVDDTFRVVERVLEVDVDSLYRFARTDATEATLEASIVELLSPGGPSPSKEQLRLLADARKHWERHGEGTALHLRGMSREAALVALEAARGGQRYLRVVTGKGLHSAGEPVLKRALVTWCAHHGVQWAPQILNDRSFGSFVLRWPRKR
jgi:hypothetical protein